MRKLLLLQMIFILCTMIFTTAHAEEDKISVVTEELIGVFEKNRIYDYPKTVGTLLSCEEFDLAKKVNEISVLSEPLNEVFEKFRGLGLTETEKTHIKNYAIGWFDGVVNASFRYTKIINDYDKNACDVLSKEFFANIMRR